MQKTPGLALVLLLGTGLCSWSLCSLKPRGQRNKIQTGVGEDWEDVGALSAHYSSHQFPEC